MANNPHVLDNLKNFTSETARENQKKSAAKRVQNRIERGILCQAFKEIMNGMMNVPEPIRNSGCTLGSKMGKKEPLSKVVAVNMMTDIIKNKKWSLLFKVAEFAGMSFEQSPEALGGAENPINVNNRIGPPSEEYKEAMRDQASMLGIIEKGN